jgi:elongation factor G
VNLKPPRIPYRETITAATEAHGRHKKQTGGHGQFGDCKIKVEPLPRGSDFQFVDDIFGGSIPRSSFPPSRRASRIARCAGFLGRLPDGRLQGDRSSTARSMQVDSNELSFKMAGTLAVQGRHDARASPTILEPDHAGRGLRTERLRGDLMGDLNGRRGPHRPGMDTRGVMTGHPRQVPMAEMLTYEQHLTVRNGRPRARTTWSSRTTKRCRSHLQGKIISAAKAERGQEVAEEV